MSILLEKLRKKTQTILMSTKDDSLLEQIYTIKKNLYVDTTLATLLHSNHFDHKWNPRVHNKIQEHVDSLYKNKRHENIKKTIFEYLDGWVGKEDVDGLTFFVFPSRVGDISYDPKDNKEFDIITNYIQDKIIDIFPLSSGQALALAIEYTNPTTFPDWDKGWDTLGLKPLNEHKKRELNPKVKPGDVIRVVSLDSGFMEYPGDTSRFEFTKPENYSLGKIIQTQQTETEEGEEVTMMRVYFPELEGGVLDDDGVRILMDPHDKYIKSDEVLTEAGIVGGGSKPRRNIPDNIRGNLVQATFTRGGGWGRPSQKFTIFMTPTGKVADIQQSSGMSNSQIPFEVDQTVSFGDLYRFEQDSPFDLQMKGRLHEHNDEQLNMFPTGQWDWPKEMDGFEEEDIEDIKKAVSERQVKFLFNKWDEDGVSFEDLKLLGVPANSGVINALLMKRYILSGTRPLPVSFSFDCTDLADMFITNNNYNMGYVEDFLCGKDSFWDSEDWYAHEWYDGITYDIDEKNWKSISDIFGGVSKSDADNILNRTSSSEEVDKLIEKYDGQIDDIRHHLLWAHSDGSEYATKEAMSDDILDKLAEHFDDGKLVRSEKDGSYSWEVNGDLRNWLDLDDWDDPSKFEFHPDYAGETLENILTHTSPSYIGPQILFEALIKEKYTFEDYDYGAQGDKLETETKWFDGYFQPEYDVNSSLSDRLGEVEAEASPDGTYFGGPLNEQEQKIRVKTIYEDDNWKYIWPLNDYSFCELTKGVENKQKQHEYYRWCIDGKNPQSTHWTTYLLQNKNTGEMFKFDDREKVPGLPSGDVIIQNETGTNLNIHRFLADKPALHDMFHQTYTTFELMKYGVKLNPNILEDYSKTNKFAELVYKMIKNPSVEIQEELENGGFFGDELDVRHEYSPPDNSVVFGDEGLSIYYADGVFKEEIMGVDQDDEWVFDMGTDRYNHEDHCEEMDEDELQYIGYHINSENGGRLNELVTMLPSITGPIDWGGEGNVVDFMEDIGGKIWNDNSWELLQDIGCSVGRARVKAITESLVDERVFDYEYQHGRGNWKLDMSYTQLLYVIGDLKLNNLSEFKNLEINHIDGGLSDTWYDAWDMDKEGLEAFNDTLKIIIDELVEYIGDDIETISKNNEKYQQTLKDLGFGQRYSRSSHSLKIDLGEKKVKEIVIHSYDPKEDIVTFILTIDTSLQKGGTFKRETVKVPIDQLSDYAVSEELLESV